MIDGVVPHDEYCDEMDMLGISQFLDAVQHEPFLPLELFGVSIIKIIEKDQTSLALKLPTFVIPTINIDSTHGSLALKAYQQNLYLEYYY